MNKIKFEPTICSDCSYPPNFIVTALPAEKNREFFSVKCRDCGDIWKEAAGDPVDDDETSN